MFSKSDIYKELGKGINIYPFNENNIKENSINLSASKYSWAMKSGKVFIDKDGNIYKNNHNNNLTELHISRGKSCVRKINEKEYIILLPLSTTLIETKEVLAIDNYIGGTYHSKVGIVSLGIGHIGTMVGPNFCGHSLIAIHNVSDYPLKIDINDTIVSVIFYYLKTPIDFKNATENGHLDKMANFGIRLDKDELENINQDWKKDIVEVRSKMLRSESFKIYKKEMRKRKFSNLKEYINLVNMLKFFIAFGVFIGTYEICKHLDIKNGNTVWIDRFWNIGLSGSLVLIIQKILSSFNPKSRK